MSYQRVTEPKLTDDLLLFRDNCFVLISYEDFIKDQVTGGFNVCEAIQNCFESSNCFDNVTPEPEDNLPQFTNLLLSLNNRRQNRAFTQAEFDANWTDVDGNQLHKIVIVGGDLSGLTFNGQPLYLGQTIYYTDIANLVYNAKDVDSAYQQVIDIELYDENNVKAI